jgi:hypothetical protein
MYPPNGRKGAQRLAKLFPANRRTSVRPRPRLPVQSSGTNRPLVPGCGQRPWSRKAATAGSEVGRSPAASHAAAEDGRQTWAASAPTVCGGYGLRLERVLGERLGARLSGARRASWARGERRAATHGLDNGEAARQKWPTHGVAGLARQQGFAPLAGQGSGARASSTRWAQMGNSA